MFSERLLVCLNAPRKVLRYKDWYLKQPVRNRQALRSVNSRDSGQYNDYKLTAYIGLLVAVFAFNICTWKKICLFGRLRYIGILKHLLEQSIDRAISKRTSLFLKNCSGPYSVCFMSGWCLSHTLPSPCGFLTIGCGKSKTEIWRFGEK